LTEWSTTSVKFARRTRVPRERLFSCFEFWPSWLFYAPVVLHWIWLALRHRSLTLPTVANPLMELGGLCGDSKLHSFAQFGPIARRWLAPAVGLTREAGEPLEAVCDRAEALMRAPGIAFPVVGKPDVGCRGTGVQLITGRAKLESYIDAFPSGERLVLQRLVPYEGEAGVFYVRQPGRGDGRIVSLTLKHFPAVVGDGSSTLAELIDRDPRAGRIPHLYQARHAERLGQVPEPGEAVRLVFAGNHCRGAVFQDGTALVTPELTARIGEIAADIPEFHFGRFDLRFASLRSLLDGDGFTIIEVNGAGSEMTHIWDKDVTLADAYGALATQLHLAFSIGAVNRARGFRPTPPVALLRAWLHERRLARSCPMTE
jgi:hypothetical protein